MFIVKKIIKGRQMRVAAAKDSSFGRQNKVMQEFREKGGAEILKNRKVYQRQFWKDLRANSIARKKAGGDRGFTKKDLIDFFAEKKNNTEDNFTTRQIRKIYTKVYGLKRTKVTRRAAEMQKQERLLTEHQNLQTKAAENQKKDAEFHSHINEILERGKEKSPAGAIAAAHPAFAGGKMSYADSYRGEDKKAQYELLNKFEKSDRDLKYADNYLFHQGEVKSPENNSQAFGHLLYLKNKKHDFASEQEEEEVKTRKNELTDRLKLLQGGGAKKNEEDDLKQAA